MNNQDDIQRMVNAASYCVVGASRDRTKYGYQVWRTLKSEGKKAYPVNPFTDIVGKSVCYPTVADLPEPVEVAVLVGPPDVTDAVVREVHAAGIKNVWMQPRVATREAVDYCEANGIAVVADGPCIMTMVIPPDDDD
jgi:predicted CoA-binding protein